LSDLGEVSLHHDFRHRLFAQRMGTSQAAPRIAHLAARLFARYPQASPELVKALIVAHARVPRELEECVAEAEDRCRLAGYGRPELNRTLLSSESCVSLTAEQSLGENQSHFYEIPFPEDFHGEPRRRVRRVTVALAHTPTTRRTRIAYKTSTVEFRIVQAASVEDVLRVFRKASAADQVPNIPEKDFVPKATLRGKGTVQATSRVFKQTRATASRLFVVVTRNVAPWAQGLRDQENYALVVVMEDESDTQVRFYTQLRARLEERVRPRLRP
jgi:hypothetical protein